MNHVNAIRCNDEYQCSHCGKSWDIHEEAPDCKMTLVSPIKMKTVDYFGLSLDVPEGSKCITTDANGTVCAWHELPETNDYETEWGCAFPPSVVAHVHLHGLDWRETLRKC